MSTTLAILILWLGSASASCDFGGAIGYGWGPGSFGTNVSNITTQAVYDRVQTPGATSSVTFNFTAFPGVQEQWTWRVNVTNVRVGDLPNNGAYAENGAKGFGQELEDPHFVNVAYDFQWPEGGEIQDTLNRTFSESGAHTSTGPGQLCAAYFDMQGLPSDITNRYKESDNGDCTGVFGEDCIAAMLDASALWSGNGGVCGLPGRGFTELPQCQSIFNTTKYPGRFCGANGGQQLGNITSSEEITYPPGVSRPLTSGESFMFHSYRQTNGTNETLYQKANQELQVIVLSAIPGSRQMLCQRVNKTDAPTSSAATVGASFANALSIFGLVALVSLL